MRVVSQCSHNDPSPVACGLRATGCGVVLVVRPSEAFPYFYPSVSRGIAHVGGSE